jgi:hypothetical protein
VAELRSAFANRFKYKHLPHERLGYQFAADSDAT